MLSDDSFTVLALLLFGGFVWTVLIAIVFVLLRRDEQAKRAERQRERESQSRRWSL